MRFGSRMPCLKLVAEKSCVGFCAIWPRERKPLGIPQPSRTCRCWRSCARKKSSRKSMSEISNYIEHHQKTVIPLYRDYSLRFWDLSLAGNDASEKELVAATETYLQIYNNREEFQQIQHWLKSDPKLSAGDARQLKLIHDTFVPHQIEKDLLRD